MKSIIYAFKVTMLYFTRKYKTKDKNMKKIAIAMLFAGSTLLMADGAAAYAKCAGCHGANGEKAALGKSAVITGQDAAKTVEQLNGYKAGTLNQHGMGAVMKGQVASMDDAAIKAVADHIAAMK
jgi:cytochrome c553